MTDPAALTDEELADMDEKVGTSLVSSSAWGRVYSRDVPRLIAALRASRAEIERLEHELAETSEAFELARAGSWTGWKDMQ